MIGREPLPRQEPLQALFPVQPIGRTGYAVLAPLSVGYPPPRVRYLTRYSAVCHYLMSGPKTWKIVRLACIRRAASVRPEPGSNSLLIKNLPSTIQLLKCNGRDNARRELPLYFWTYICQRHSLAAKRDLR